MRNKKQKVRHAVLMGSKEEVHPHLLSLGAFAGLSGALQKPPRNRRSFNFPSVLRRKVCRSF